MWLGSAIIGNPHEALKPMVLVEYRNQAAEEQRVALSENRRQCRVATRNEPHATRTTTGQISCSANESHLRQRYGGHFVVVERQLIPRRGVL